jgi:hypothetical protein
MDVKNIFASEHRCNDTSQVININILKVECQVAYQQSGDNHWFCIKVGYQIID